LENEKKAAYDMAQAMMRFFKIFKPRRFIQNINPTEMMVIMSVFFFNKEGNKSVNPSDISEELGLSKSALTAVLNSLEEKDLIERRLSDNDRRRIVLNLSEKGTALVQAHHQNHHKCMENSFLRLSSHLGKEDSEKFIELLNKAIDFLSD
jgi:DNA-binding MarR family transcriptional regulator